MSYLPKHDDLDNEQKEIYLNASLNRPVLITGPPGSGKTVMGVWRSVQLMESNFDMWYIAYNNTLISFTETWLKEASNEQNLQADQDLSITTFHSWFGRKYSNVFNTRGFPHVHGDPFMPDWEEIHNALFNSSEDVCKDFFSDRLVIDEGQDFSPDLYSLLGYMHIKVNLQVTVLMDENQRLDRVQNCTIDEMRSTFNLFARKKTGGTNEQYLDEYALTNNYRNTKQIAEVAALFYNVLQTGRPKIPTKKGPKPSYKNFNGMNECVDFITDYASINPSVTVGVIINSTAAKRNRYFAKLQEKGELNGRVQTYAGPDDLGFLDLHAQGRITVLHMKSAKGLEFDTVFAVDLEDLSLQGAELDNAKMDLYVLFSRPREELFLCCSELTEGQLPDIFLRDEFQELQQGLLDIDFDTDIKEEHEEEIFEEEAAEEIKEESIAEAEEEKLEAEDPEKITPCFIAMTNDLEEAIYQIINIATDTSDSERFILGQFAENKRLQKKTVQNLSSRVHGLYSPSGPKLQGRVNNRKVEIVTSSFKKAGRDDILILTDMQNVKESDQEKVLKLLKSIHCSCIYILFKGMEPQSSPVYKELMEKISPRMIQLDS